MYNFKQFQEEITNVIEHYKTELVSIRTGRATPALLDSVKVSLYGSKVPLQQVGAVTTEDARTLRVLPWEKDAVNQIEQAIRDADLGVSLSSDEKGVRVCFPELTSERREQLVKLTNTKLEDARISLRKHREETWSDIQEQHKASLLSEDEKFRSKDKMEELVKDGNTALEALAKKKVTELNS